MVNVKPFKDMTDEEKVQYLEERKANSKKKYESIYKKNKEVHAKRKIFRANVHTGNDILSKHEAEVKEGKKPEALMWSFFPCSDRGFEGSILVFPQTWDNEFIDCRYAYAIKAPTDAYKPHVAKGLCSFRINETNSPWSGDVTIPRFVFEEDKQKLQSAVTGKVIADILLCEDHIPARLVRALYKDPMKQWYKKVKAEELQEMENNAQALTESE